MSSPGGFAPVSNAGIRANRNLRARRSPAKGGLRWYAQGRRGNLHRWCAAARRQALPASAATVAAFIDAMAAGKALATVRRFVSSIIAVHKAGGVASPCATETVRLALQRMHRERGRAQTQAAPLNDELVAHMPAAGHSLRDLRNKPLLAVASTALCRRAELVALQRTDLQIESDGFGTVTIRRGKTDQEAAGDVAPITPDATWSLKAWITAAALTTASGPLFRGVLKGGRLTAARDAGEVARIVKALAGKAGLTTEETARISGHSTRIGASARSWNVAPMQSALVVRRHPESSERHLHLLKWGLLPSWSKDSPKSAAPDQR